MGITDKLLLLCKSSLAVKFLCNDANKIINALENTTDLKNAAALIANLTPIQYVLSLSRVKSLEIAKYIVQKYTDSGSVIDFTDTLRCVPYYSIRPNIDVELNVYFIKMGADFSCFTDEYLQELYEFGDIEVNEKILNHIN